MSTQITLRKACAADKAGVDALLAKSYPTLLVPAYPPALLARCLPIIAVARPELLASERYYVATDPGGSIVGAGGYSLSTPAQRGGPAGQVVAGLVVAGLGHIRHVATDPDKIRLGIGSAIMTRIFSDAAADGVQRFECLSTLGAVAFYAAHGFKVLGSVDLPLGPDVLFPAVRMERTA